MRAPLLEIEKVTDPKKEAQAQSRWRPRAPDVARDQIHLRLTDFRHASPACDRTYNRSRAARPARLTAVETYLLARCDHSLLGALGEWSAALAGGWIA